MAAPRTREVAALTEAVAEAHHLTISAHTAPSLHLAPALALPGLDHLEWFHDHVRIERMLFDGAPMPSAV